MGCSILCTARKGPKEAIQYLVLADHSKTPQYWTSDDPYDLMSFPTLQQATQVCSRLRFNDPFIVLTSHAIRVLSDQRARLAELVIGVSDNDDCETPEVQ